MPLPTHRTTASVLRIRRTGHAHTTPARTRLNGSGKAAHDHPSTGLGSRTTPRLQPLPHPNELSRELGWVQGWGTMCVSDHGYMVGWDRATPTMSNANVTLPFSRRPTLQQARIQARTRNGGGHWAVVVYLLMVVVLTGCVHVKPPKDIMLRAIDQRTSKPMPGLNVRLEGRDADAVAWRQLDAAGTGQLGVAGFRVPKKSRKACQQDSILRLVVSDSQSGRVLVIPVNGYRTLYETAFGTTVDTADPFRVADMHYHISMRAHNRFGQDIYALPRDPGDSRRPPPDATWYKDVNKLCARVDGRWVGVRKLTWKRLRRAQNAGACTKNYKLYASLFAGNVRPATANNKLGHYTQATHPHMRAGKVRLGFNAISPFESNLVNKPFKRGVGSIAKSGADQHWLRRIGSSTSHGRLTHWENFLLEYGMMRDQDPSIDGMHWRFLRDGRELKNASDTVGFLVNVIEGGHALQHHLFPNEVDYDMSDRSEEVNEKLLERYEELYEDPATDAVTRAALAGMHQGIQQVRQVEQARSDSSGWFGLDQRAVVDSLKNVSQAEKKDLFAQVDGLLEDELKRNIRQLKALDPPVHMMTVAHLSYNGMLGHSPALDDGTPLGRLVARRVYAIRASEDEQYLDQWKGLFFTVPGVNRFGALLMRDLLDTANGPRVLIDLKHSDPQVRRYFYDSLMTNDVPPICSHCGVNGMPLDHWSPFNDEYAILRAPFTRIHYPFGINLYNEEIKYIHRHGGIIGLPLEHRVLGGYINKVNHYEHRVDRKGRVIAPGLRKRFNQDRNLLRWLREISADGHLLDAAYDYTRTNLAVPEPRVRETVADDYLSVEPLLQNLFLIIDTIAVDASARGISREPAYPWRHVCIGSDLDGVIDPIEICPTADQYELLRDRMKQFIPVFLHLRYTEAKAVRTSGERLPFVMTEYFRDGFTLDDALHAFFYGSLREFTLVHFQR